MSCDVYTKFRGAGGKLMDTLMDDAKGLLSLYEAAYLRVEGEDFLEEVLVLTKARLKTMLPNLSPNLAEQVNIAMKCSLWRSLQRVHAISYISVYEKDPSKNYLLLRFAKTDYNLVQLLHLQEIRDVSRWWKELHSKLPYARDRVVEGYFFAIANYFEPRYSLARVILSKAIAMVSLLDDTYDAHATLDELKIFTDATDRWDIKCIPMIPDYMKILYKALLDLFEEFEEEMANQGRSYAVNAARGEMKELLRSYYTEAKWFIEGYAPSFDEYIENGIITSTGIILTTVSFLGMELATEDVFHWMATRPKAAVDAAMIGRLMDDVSTYEVEKERGQLVTGIDCYMKQYGASKEKATHDFRTMVEKAWQGLTEECLRTNPISIRILQQFVYFSCTIEAVYRGREDGYTHPEKVLQDTITSLLLTPQVNVNDG